MSQGISITVLGDDAGVQKALHALDTALNPVAVAEFLGVVVDPYLRQRAKARFDQEGDDVTGKWAPLHDSTQNIRAQMGYGAAHPINKREGDLEAYVTQSPNRLEIAPWGASVTLPGSPPQGDMKDKMIGAQMGGLGQTSAPPRPVLGMNERDLAFVLLAMAEHVERVGKTL
jgi:hypothetical protein